MITRMKEILVGQKELCTTGAFLIGCIFVFVTVSFVVCFNLDKVVKRFSCAGGIISELSLLCFLAGMLFSWHYF